MQEVIKPLFTIFLLGTLSASCLSRKSDVDNLPKDISKKPIDSIKKDSVSLVQKDEKPKLSVNGQEILDLKNEIETLISNSPCENPIEWRMSPMGSKPCGGPERYIAYPIKEEEKILKKIDAYTHMQETYNKENNSMSDCAMVLPPTKILCVEGKAVLSNDNQ